MKMKQLEILAKVLELWQELDEKKKGWSKVILSIVLLAFTIQSHCDGTHPQQVTTQKEKANVEHRKTPPRVVRPD